MTRAEFERATWVPMVGRPSARATANVLKLACGRVRKGALTYSWSARRLRLPVQVHLYS